METAQTSFLSSILPFGGLSRRKRSFFYTQMAQMLDAGMTPLRGLSLLSNQPLPRRLKNALPDMADHIEVGGTISSAMERHPDLFPAMEIRMIQAAEYAGAVPGTLNRLSGFLFWMSNTINRIFAQMAYPAVLLFVAFVFLPLFTATFIGGLEDAVRQIGINAVSMAVILYLIFIVWRILTGVPWFRYAIHAIVLRIPVIGRAVRQIARARFLHTLECLYTAGVPTPEAVSIAAEACGNEPVSRRILHFVPTIQDGNPITDALSASRMFDPIGLGVLEVGEQSGKFDESLHRCAEYESRKAEDILTILARILPVLVYLIVAAFIVFSIILPGFSRYFNMIQANY